MRISDVLRVKGTQVITVARTPRCGTFWRSWPSTGSALSSSRTTAPRSTNRHERDIVQALARRALR